MFESHNKLKVLVASLPFALCASISIVFGVIGFISGEIADFLHDWTLKPIKDENR